MAWVSPGCRCTQPGCRCTQPGCRCTQPRCRCTQFSLIASSSAVSDTADAAHDWTCICCAAAAHDYIYAAAVHCAAAAAGADVAAAAAGADVVAAADVAAAADVRRDSWLIWTAQLELSQQHGLVLHPWSPGAISRVILMCESSRY